MLRTFSQCEYRMLNIFYFRAQCTCYIHLFSLKHDFFLQHNMLCKKLLLNSATLLYKANLIFFLKIYRSSIFRKYIVHFFVTVTTVLFWRSNFQIRMYHKKITYLVYNCTIKKQKDSLVFYVHKFCLNSVNNISNILKGRTSYLIFTK